MVKKLFRREGDDDDYILEIDGTRYYDTPTNSGGPAPYFCFSFCVSHKGRVARLRMENVINLRQLKWAICNYFSVPYERGQLWFEDRVCPSLDLYKFMLASYHKNYLILVDLLDGFTREQLEGVITSLFNVMVERDDGIPHIEMRNYNVGDKEFELSLKPLPEKGMPDVTRFKVLQEHYQLFFTDDSDTVARAFLSKLVEKVASDRPFFNSALNKHYPVKRKRNSPAKKKRKLSREDHLLLVQQTRENMEKQLEEFRKEQSRKSGKIVHSDHASVNIKLL